MPIIVNKFDNVYLKPEGGEKYAVSSFLMILAENGLPLVRIVIDPAHTYKQGFVSGSFDSPPATAATLGVIIKWHEDFQLWATEKKKAEFNMDVYRNDTPDLPGSSPVLDQKINLKDWLITGAGIVGANAGGSFALEIELQHPLVGADYAPSGLFAYAEKMAMEVADAEDFTDIPDGIQKTLRHYADGEAADMWDFLCGGSTDGTQEDMRDKLAEQIKKAATVIQKHLKWVGELPPVATPAGVAAAAARAEAAAAAAAAGTAAPAPTYKRWPVEWCWEGDIKFVKLALVDYIGGNAEASPWELLAHRFVTEWGVCIVPTYWKDHLEMRPVGPWHDPAIILDETDINDIQFPGVDPSPLAGILIPHGSPASAGSYSIYVKDDGSKQRGETETFVGNAEITYIPNAILAATGDKYRGRVYQVSPPHWCGSAGRNQSASDGDKTSVKRSERAKKLRHSGVTKPGESAGTEVATAQTLETLDKTRYSMARAAKYTYLQRFRSQVQLQLRCRLLFTSLGSKIDPVGGRGYIIPGNVIRIKDTGALSVGMEGPTMPTDVFDFYCTNVVHSVDCQSGQVSTQISGRHVRPVGEFKDLAESGDLNPLYSDQG